MRIVPVDPPSQQGLDQGEAVGGGQATGVLIGVLDDPSLGDGEKVTRAATGLGTGGGAWAGGALGAKVGAGIGACLGGPVGAAVGGIAGGIIGGAAGSAAGRAIADGAKGLLHKMFH